jgi:hypothetical protein
MSPVERYRAAELGMRAATQACWKEIRRRVNESNGALYWHDMNPTTPAMLLRRKMPDGTTKTYGFDCWPADTLEKLMEDDR